MSRFNMFQNYNNVDANYSNTANTKVHEYGEEIAKLKNQVERLNLITEGMWELLKEKGMKDEDLVAAISRVDEAKKAKKKALEEGSEDKNTVLCPNCHVPLQNNGNLANRCIYCGHEIITSPFKT